MNQKKLTQVLLKKYLIFSVIVLTGIGFYIALAPIIFQAFFPKYVAQVLEGKTVWEIE